MNRIDTINARENMFGVGKSGFHDNADLPEQDATYVSPGWFNTVQEELCNLLELRGITLDPASKRQLYDLLTTQADLEALADEIETNFIRKSQIVDNLTTNDATKVASAKQVKILQDNKLEAKDIKDASTTQKGVAQIAELSDVLTGVDNNKIITASLLAQVNFSSAVNVVDVTASRVKNTVYTNPYDHPIEVYVGTNKTSSSVTLLIYLDGKEIHNLLNDGDGNCNCWSTFTVRAHGEYSVNTSGSIVYWRERISA